MSNVFSTNLSLQRYRIHYGKKIDDCNLGLAKSAFYVDQINAEFYGKFPYPRLVMKLDYLEDPTFETTILDQNLVIGGINLFRIICAYGSQGVGLIRQC